jgi:hypothetical protein
MALPLFIVGVVILIAALVVFRYVALRTDRRKAQEDSQH